MRNRYRVIGVGARSDLFSLTLRPLIVVANLVCGVGIVIEVLMVVVVAVVVLVVVRGVEARGLIRALHPDQHGSPPRKTTQRFLSYLLLTPRSPILRTRRATPQITIAFQPYSCRETRPARPGPGPFPGKIKPGSAKPTQHHLRRPQFRLLRRRRGASDKCTHPTRAVCVARWVTIVGRVPPSWWLHKPYYPNDRSGPVRPTLLPFPPPRRTRRRRRRTVRGTLALSAPRQWAVRLPWTPEAP
jgi:hypothetical protein